MQNNIDTRFGFVDVEDLPELQPGFDWHEIIYDREYHQYNAEPFYKDLEEVWDETFADTGVPTFRDFLLSCYERRRLDGTKGLRLLDSFFRIVDYTYLTAGQLAQAARVDDEPIVSYRVIPEIDWLYDQYNLNESPFCMGKITELISYDLDTDVSKYANRLNTTMRLIASGLYAEMPYHRGCIKETFKSVLQSPLFLALFAESLAHYSAPIGDYLGRLLRSGYNVEGGYRYSALKKVIDAQCKPGDLLLDLGCGSGISSKALARIFPQISFLAIDKVNHTSIEPEFDWHSQWDRSSHNPHKNPVHLQLGYPVNLSFIQAGVSRSAGDNPYYAEGLPLVDCSINTVLLGSVLNNLSSSGQFRILSEAYRVLKEGGTLLVEYQDDVIALKREEIFSKSALL